MSRTTVLSVFIVCAVILLWAFTLYYHTTWCNGKLIAHLDRGALTVYYPDNPNQLRDPWTGGPWISDFPPYWGEQSLGMDVSRVTSRRWLLRFPVIRHQEFMIGGWEVRIPLWIPIIIVASLGALLAAYRHRLRLCQRLCSACGYNLTGNVSGKCPECGAVVPEDLVQREKDGGRGSKASQRHEQGEPES